MDDRYAKTGFEEAFVEPVHPAGDVDEALDAAATLLGQISGHPTAAEVTTPWSR